jgi:hypothetical protein
MRGNRAALAAVVITAALMPTAAARAVTVNVCLAGKLTDVGKTVAARLACAARDAVQPSADLLATCLANVDDRFDGGADPLLGRFAKREFRTTCVTFGDQSTLAARIATYTASVDSAIAKSARSNRCDAVKLKCVGRYVAAVNGCLARAASSTGTIDPGCLAKQRTRLVDPARGCLQRGEFRDPCSVSGDAAALAAGADAFSAQTVCALDPSGTATCAGLPTPAPTPSRTATPVATRTPTAVPTANANGVEQLCVDTINAYRATIGRAPLARWTAAESCAEDQGFADAATQTAHSAFGQCGEWAQNECPGWPGPSDVMIANCLAAMWSEGPGSNFATHGHYINMANGGYTKVACGFAVLPDGKVWAVQDFQ